MSFDHSELWSLMGQYYVGIKGNHCRGNPPLSAWKFTADSKAIVAPVATATTTKRAIPHVEFRVFLQMFRTTYTKTIYL